MIRLTDLLLEGERDDPNYVQYWMIKHAPSIAKQLGETVSELLGGGANGLAWSLTSGRVMKLTPDTKEVAAASRYRTKQSVPHLVAVYDVRPITGNRASAESPEFGAADNYWKSRQATMINITEPWYVIIMDHVTPLTDAEQFMWWRIQQYYLETRWSDAEVLEAMQQRESDLPAAKGQLPAGWNERLMQQRSSVIAAFRRNRVYAAEAHGENMGWNQQGKLVHFDWWMLSDPKLITGSRYEYKPRRLNKPVRYDATGIDTPGDPNM